MLNGERFSLKKPVIIFILRNKWDYNRWNIYHNDLYRGKDGIWCFRTVGLVGVFRKTSCGGGLEIQAILQTSYIYVPDVRVPR